MSPYKPEYDSSASNPKTGAEYLNTLDFQARNSQAWEYSSAYFSSHGIGKI